MPFQVVNSPFNKEQAKVLSELVPTLTETQKVWLSGYLAAIHKHEATTEEKGILSPQNNTTIMKEVTILYGSQTGNSQGLAKKTGQRLESLGLKVTVSSMNDFKPNQLKKLEYLLIIVSTHGEGDPPDLALTFYDYLHSKRAPKLKNLHFSVLALGDSSYEFFCKTGEDFDRRLEELGGARLYPRTDCDIDFDELAEQWIEGVLSKLVDAKAQEHISEATATLQTAESIYTRTNPYQAEVLETIKLNGRGSSKETYHIELSLEESGITFEPGDSLGVFPVNDRSLVEQILNELNWDKETIVTVKQGETRTLKDALHSVYEITVLTKPLLKKVEGLTQNSNLQTLMESENVKEYIEGRDLLDLIRDFGIWGKSAQEFVSVLRSIPPRLYSIASSFSAFPDEAHLTVGAVRYKAHERDRNGVCSIQIAEHIKPGDFLPVFVQHNDSFKLPKSPETPIIMIGPGTGVAPFRSFLQEREEMGAEGKSWLFFGDQHFGTDFLYQLEWQSWLRNGVLSKMDVAFSRDQTNKVYVQHRMLEHSREIYAWLEEGAYVYVCGDEKKMAHDVHHTLIEIIQQEGSLSRNTAEEYVANLQQQRRYQRDVY